MEHTPTIQPPAASGSPASNDSVATQVDHLQLPTRIGSFFWGVASVALGLVVAAWLTEDAIGPNPGTWDGIYYFLTLPVGYLVGLIAGPVVLGRLSNVDRSARVGLATVGALTPVLLLVVLLKIAG